MKSVRLLTVFFSSAVLVALSCGRRVETSDRDTPVPVQEPTPERLIVYTSSPNSPYRLGLLFGGTDGRQRIELRRTNRMLGVSICPGSKLAAVVEADWNSYRHGANGEGWPRWLSFYDVEGRVVSKVDLPRKPKQFGDAIIYPGPRREALVTLIRPTLSDTPNVVLEPGEVAWYHVATDGKVTELPAAGFDQGMFTAGPGYVLRVPDGKAWRLLRYSEPNKLLWEIRIKGDSPGLMLPAGFDVGVMLRWRSLYFRADGTYEVRKHDPKELAASNPGYRESAGQAYEREYLGVAVEQLAKAAGLTRSEQQAARDALRQFIYAYLDVGISGGGWVSASKHRVCLDHLDSAMSQALPEKKDELYLAWRRQADRQRNALEFLLKEHVLEEPEEEEVVIIKPDI